MFIRTWRYNKTRNVRPRASIRLILGLLISFVALPAQAQQQDEILNPPLSIYISTPQQEIKVGSKVIVNIVLTNISGRTLQTYGLAEYPSPHIYTIKLLDEKGALPPRTQIGRINLDSGIIIGTPDDFGGDFAAGGTVKQTIELTTFFALDSGMYTIQLERGQANATIKSNTITFRVVPNTQLEGSVLDQTGGFIAGANVVLFSAERVLTTKANEDGKFKFAPLPSGAHYIEASSPGFFSDSISVKDETREVSVALEPATGGGVLIACFPSIPPTSVSYEERRGNAQLIGTVTEPLGSPVPHTSITLLRSDLAASFDDGKNQSRHLGMKQRSFKESIAAQMDSNEKGEFQFDALEPGWYTLMAAHSGYENGSTRFWVARENLTRVTRINLLPRLLPEWPNCGGVPAPEKPIEQRP
jgi:hypothetical protein